MSDIFLINGIPGAGKSTTARALASRLPRAVHIEGDFLQDMIISGSVSPGQLPQAESDRQIHLNVRNQCLLAKSFASEGFIPILDYVIVNRDRVEEYRGHLPGFDLHLVTLAPGIPTALDRDQKRPEKTVAHFWIHLDEIIRSELSGVGLWIDNSTLTVEETVTHILTNQAAARIDAGH